jgi:hypothetical protein
MSAALTPRVRVLVVCDGIRASRIEENVFTLRGARYQISADSFPLRRRLQLFLVLSCPRQGRFPAYVQVVEDQTDRTVFHTAHLLRGRPPKLLLISTGNIRNRDLEALMAPLIPDIVREFGSHSFLELGPAGIVVRG